MTQSEVERIQQHFERMFREGVTPWTEHGMEPDITRFADWLLEETREPVLLDIGCGDGWVSVYFGSRGIRVDGIDSSPTAIERARRAAREAGVDNQVAFTVGSGLDLPYPAARFHAVFDRGFFHHVPEDEYPQYLREVSRVLKPSGWLSLHAFTERNPRGIGHRFSAEDVARIFRGAFTVVKQREDPWPTDAPAHLGHYLIRVRNDRTEATR